MSRTAWTYAAADSLAATPAIPAAPITTAPAPAANSSSGPNGSSGPRGSNRCNAPGRQPAAALSARPHPHPAAPAAADTLAAADSLAGAAPPDSLASLFSAGRTPRWGSSSCRRGAARSGAVARHDRPGRLRRGVGAVPAGKTPAPDTDSLTENGVFQSFRPAAGRHVRHAALPQHRRHPDPLRQPVARGLLARAADRGPRQQRFFALPAS